jgi:hypothetical protein
LFHFDTYLRRSAKVSDRPAMAGGASRIVAALASRCGFFRFGPGAVRLRFRKVAPAWRRV